MIFLIVRKIEAMMVSVPPIYSYFEEFIGYLVYFYMNIIMAKQSEIDEVFHQFRFQNAPYIFKEYV